MSDTLQPLIHKAQLMGLRVHVARAGLCLGDAARALPLEDGSIAVEADGRRPLLGLLPRRRSMILGHLGPAASRIIAPAIAEGRPLRLRIVGLTPEHLAGPQGPEVHVSVWGEARSQPGM